MRAQLIVALATNRTIAAFDAPRSSTLDDIAVFMRRRDSAVDDTVVATRVNLPHGVVTIHDI